MTSPKETDTSRSQTDHSLRAERDRADDEIVTRANPLAEHAGGTHAHRFDERERRQAALFRLLAYERSVTDKALADERELADRSMTAREDLLAIVAHDLRNMLSAVVINASNIMMARELETVRKPASKIQTTGAQMEQLLEDLLDFACFEAGKVNVALADVDVVDVVADAVAIHEEVAAAHTVALTMRSGVQSATIRGDAKRLTRLLMNVIGNAMKFTPARGRIDVSIRLDGDECEVAVSDTGIGIPADQLQSIFERFQQAGAAPRRSSGVGLGLYIARLIADAHGGRIWAENAPSGGATFRLRLPTRSP